MLPIPDSCLQFTLIGSITSSVVSGGLLVGGLVGRGLVDGGAVAGRIALRRGNSGSSSIGVVGRCWGWGRSDDSGGNDWDSIYLRGNCRG